MSEANQETSGGPRATALFSGLDAGDNWAQPPGRYPASLSRVGFWQSQYAAFRAKMYGPLAAAEHADKDLAELDKRFGGSATQPDVE